MNHSRPLPKHGCFTETVKEIAELILVVCPLFLTLQASIASEPEIKGSWQSDTDVGISSGIAHDGIARPPGSQGGVENAKTSLELPYKYFGNSFSGKFHRPWCPYSQAMNARHVVPFHFRFQAIADGYQPCNFCLPQQWKSVHCILLKQSPGDK